jgi:squalene cyclase
MLQAIVDAGAAQQFPEACAKGWRYLERSQIACDEDNRERYYRHISKGGWPFSTAAHGWPISDCTGEGLKGVLALAQQQCVAGSAALEHPIGPARLHDAVNILLSYQVSARVAPLVLVLRAVL